jgi:hypothetical protein
MAVTDKRSRRVLWCVGLLALVLGFSSVYLVHYYGETRPTIAQPDIGRVHPVAIHSRTVFLTGGEYALAIGTHAIAIVTIGIFIGMLLKARRRPAS